MRSLSLGLVLALAWLAAAPAAPMARAQLLSPGRLSKAHAKLEGDGQCNRCHASGSRVSEPLCLSCHADIAGQRQQRSGLHGTKFRDQTCGSCHVEHLGAEHALIRWPGPKAERFDHAQTRFPLVGAHRDTRCGACHARENERGAATFLGLSPRCASCHEDPHQKRFGERCQDCHDETSFARLALDDFDHALARFPLTGAHRQVECAGCHQTPPLYRDLSFADCNSCHQDPHDGRLEGSCASCHATDAWARIVLPRTRHPGLSLAGGHQRTACESCHDAGRAVAPTAGKACVGCHEPVHEAAFGTRCEDCHATVRWTGLPASVGRRAHVKTAFPLRGSHGDVKCAACHAPELPPEARYRALPHERCAGCHADVHANTLAEHGDCATCHDPIAFAPSLVTPALHGALGFALEGGHDAAACGACHAQAGKRRLDWSKRESACQDCHENPHGAQFADALKEGGCASCHAPAGWGVASFAHPAWPLTGAHAKTQCSGCHQPSAADRRAGKGASYRGAPRDCEGCHDDVHAGQFRSSEPVRSCVACHQTERFALPKFDHAAVADWVLEGKHGDAACASCHASVQLESGEQVVHYRLGYDRCADCHADPHTLPEAWR